MSKEFVRLSREETTKIFEAIRAGDKEAREEFIVHNLGLVRHNAKQLLYLKPSHIDFEDMISEGYIGLIKAVDKYDPKKGAFSTYATYWIQAEIREFLDQLHSGPKVPLQLGRAVRKLHAITGKIAQILNREPTHEELITHELVIGIAKKVNKTPSELILAAMELGQPIALDRSVAIDEIEVPILDLVPDTTESPDVQLERKDLINHLLQPLTEREKLVINHYFGINNYEQLTHKQIGNILNIGEQRVQQIKAKIVEDLKYRAKTDPEVLVFIGQL